MRDHPVNQYRTLNDQIIPIVTDYYRLLPAAVPDTPSPLCLADTGKFRLGTRSPVYLKFVLSSPKETDSQFHFP